jgi:predicted ATPase with chaperone activity
MHKGMGPHGPLMTYSFVNDKAARRYARRESIVSQTAANFAGSPGKMGSLLDIKSLLPNRDFQPSQPRTLEETGISNVLVDSLVCKHLAAAGNETGRAIADAICLSPAILLDRFQILCARQFLTHKGAAPLGDYVYTLTSHGREFAQREMDICAYRGPVPVTLKDYITSVDAQTIAAVAPRKEQLERAFQDVSIPPGLFARLGPAINSGAGMFLYGEPGNGKTTLAERITRCFEQDIWVPKTLLAGGEFIKLYDPSYHVPVDPTQKRLLKQDPHDERWIKIQRPTVVVGGELTLENLEIRHNPRTNIAEAPLQLKSNGGSLLIDDFGRQRLNHIELLNRWIVPLEKRFDFLTLLSGKKIQVPFDQLIIFSTNFDPNELVDEAFLRRIPYKIHVPDPDEEEFHRLFERNALTMGLVYDREIGEYLLRLHYRPCGRALRRCHPRDLLLQLVHYCSYNQLPLELKPEYLDLVVGNYFTSVGKP